MKKFRITMNKIIPIAFILGLMTAFFSGKKQFKTRSIGTRMICFFIVPVLIFTISCQMKNGFDIVWDGGTIVKCNGQKKMVETFNINVTPSSTYQNRNEYIEKNKTGVKIGYDANDANGSYVKVYPPDGKAVTFSHLRNAPEVNIFHVKDCQFFVGNDEDKDGLEYVIKLEFDKENHISSCYIGRRGVLGYWMERFSLVSERSQKLNKFG
ncbi:MAG: hypothetical protein DI598_15795 [Pseudopedobacter saltans]|uniref:Uncharacterized protein n=1 Tax=Pseudopedobacter saltans TaxID=151895 RepID=A0A2W5GJF3_9SPHI|nr:MAG: hypothetical protein DI598_15795 [Pseudopedobacter saltans]